MRSMATRIVSRAAARSVRALAVAEGAAGLPCAVAVLVDVVCAGAGVAVRRVVFAPVAGLQARRGDVTAAGAEVLADLRHRAAAGVEVAVELRAEGLRARGVRNRQRDHRRAEGETRCRTDSHDSPPSIG